MKKIGIVVSIIMMAGMMFAGQTATLLRTRLAQGAGIEEGRWHADFTGARKYAIENGIPFIAVWSNGDKCGHCVMFESALNSSYFKNWMASSGAVFYFGCSSDKNAKVGSSIFHWVRRKKITSYPFVRVYWPAKGIDVAMTGDKLDGKKSGTTGAKKTVANLKKSMLRAYIGGSSSVKVKSSVRYGMYTNQDSTMNFGSYKWKIVSGGTYASLSKSGVLKGKKKGTVVIQGTFKGKTVKRKISIK